MAQSPAQPPSAGQGAHLVLYDGLCGLCNRLVQFLLTHDRRGVFALASLQSAAGRAVIEGVGGTASDLTTFYVVANYRTACARQFARSTATLFVAGELGWPWKAAGLLRLFPTALLDVAYKVVARNRYRVFGRREHCLTPRPEFRGRFVE